MREMSAAEQRYKAVLAVIATGRTVTEVATGFGSQPAHDARLASAAVWITIIPAALGLPQASAAVRDCASKARFFG